MKNHWLMFVLLGSLCLFGLPHHAYTQNQSQAENITENQEKVPYDLPVVEYKGNEYDLAYLIYSESENLREIPQISDEEQKKKIVQNAIKNMIFDQILANKIKEGDFTDNLEFQSHNRLMEAQTLFKHYFQNEFRKSYEPDMEELRKRYEAKKEDYFVPPKFSFRHIFFKTIDEPKEMKEKALERAQKALALIESGSSFVEVADLMSDSETKSKVVGPFVPREYNQDDAINPILEDALLDLYPGKHTGIIETRYGYQILQLENYEPEKYKEFKEVTSTLEREYQQEQREKWLENIVDANWDEAISNFHMDVIFDENADSDAVIFEVYGEPYTKAEWNEIYSAIPDRYADLPEEEQREKVEEYVKDNIIRNLIGAELAREKGYEAIPNYQYVTNTYRNNVLAKIQLEKMTEDYLAEHPITEQDKKDFYEDNKTMFKQPTEYKAGMMTFNIPEVAEDATKYEIWKAQSDALDRAQKAIELLKAGESFEEVAKDMSDDQFADEGGQVGLVHARMEDDTKRGIAREIQGVKEGTFSSEPKKKGDSYVIYYNYGKTEPEYKPYDSPEVQERIESTLKNRKSYQYKQQLIDKLVDEEDIKVLNDVVYEMPLSRISRIPTDVPDEG